MKKQTAIILLIIVTLIWGGGFIAIKLTLDSGISAGMLNMIRGFIFSAIVFCIFPKEVLGMSKSQLKNGLMVGIFNCLGFILQAIGATHTTVSNSSFLTATNVVAVPFLAWAIYKVKPKLRNIAAVFVCMLGMAVLAGVFEAEFVLNIGDIYTVAGALGFALSIVLLSRQPSESHFAAGSFLLGFTLFIGGAVYMLIFEEITLSSVNWTACILPIIYLAVFSNFVAQSIQIVAQRHLSASTASLVLMLEGVFGSMFSILFGFEQFTVNLLIGGGLITASLVLSEIQPVSKKE